MDAVLDSFRRIQKLADGRVVIQRVDDQGNVLAQIAADIIRTFQQFRRLINQVGGQQFCEQPFLVSPVKPLQAAGKEAEGCTHINVARFALLQELCHLDHTVSGGDHIVDDDHILSFHGGTEKFMLYDRIASVNDRGIVAALIKHTHIDSKIVCYIDCTAHTAFVRADHHEMVAVDFYVRRVAEDILDERSALKYGDARFIKMELNAPTLIGAGENYSAELKVDMPADQIVIASIASEKIVQPVEPAPERYRKLPSDQILERLFIANTDNVNEYSIASVGVTKTEPVDEENVKVYMNGLAFLMTRVNVVPKNNFINMDDKPAVKDVEGGKTK